MKKIISLILILALALSLCGCGAGSKTVADENEWKALFSKETLGNVSARFSSDDGKMLTAIWVNGDIMKYNYAVTEGMSNLYYEYKDGTMYSYVLRNGEWICDNVDLSDKGVTDIHSLLLYTTAISDLADMYSKAAYKSGAYIIPTDGGDISVKLKDGKIAQITFADSATLKFTDYGKTKVKLPEIG